MPKVLSVPFYPGHGVHKRPLLVLFTGHFSNTVYSQKAGVQKGISPSKLAYIVDITSNRNM